MAILFWLPNLIAVLTFCGSLSNQFDDLLDRVESIESNQNNEPEVHEFLRSVLKHHDDFRWIQGFVQKAAKDNLLPLRGLSPKSKRSFYSYPDGQPRERYGYRYRYDRPINDVYPYEGAEERSAPNYNFADEDDDDDDLDEQIPHVRSVRSISDDNSNILLETRLSPNTKVNLRSANEPHSANNFGLQNIKQRIQITPRGANGLVNAPGFKYGWLDEDNRNKREPPPFITTEKCSTEFPNIAIDTSLGEFYFSSPHDILGYNSESLKDEKNSSKNYCIYKNPISKRNAHEPVPIQLKILDRNRLIKEITKGSKNNSIVLTLKNSPTEKSVPTFLHDDNALDKIDTIIRNDKASLNRFAMLIATNQPMILETHFEHDAVMKRAQAKSTEHVHLNGLGANMDENASNKLNTDDNNLDGSYEYRPFPITKCTGLRKSGEDVKPIVTTEANKEQNKLEDMTEPTSAAEQRELGMIDNHNGEPSVRMGATEKVLIIPFKKDVDELDEQYFPPGTFRVKPSSDMIHSDIVDGVKIKKSSNEHMSDDGHVKGGDDMLNKLKLDLEKAISADYTIGRVSAIEDDYEDHPEDEASEKYQQERDPMDETHTGEGNEPIDTNSKRENYYRPSKPGFFGRSLKSFNSLIVSLEANPMEDVFNSEKDPEETRMHRQNTRTLVEPLQTLQTAQSRDLNKLRRQKKTQFFESNKKSKNELLENISRILKKRAGNLTKEEEAKYPSGNELDIIEKTQAILLHITNPPVEDNLNTPHDADNLCTTKSDNCLKVESRSGQHNNNDVINQIFDMVNLLKSNQHNHQPLQKLDVRNVKTHPAMKIMQTKHREKEYVDAPRVVKEGYTDVETVGQDHKKFDLGYKRLARREPTVQLNSVDDFKDVIESNEIRGSNLKQRLKRQLNDDRFDDAEIDALLSPMYAIQAARNRAPRHRKFKKANERNDTTEATTAEGNMTTTISDFVENECGPIATTKINFQKMCKGFGDNTRKQSDKVKDFKKIEANPYENREEADRVKKLRDKDKKQRQQKKLEKSEKRLKEKEHLKDILNGNLVLNLMDRFTEKLKQNSGAFSRFGHAMEKKCAEEQVSFLRSFRDEQAKKEVRHAQLMLHQIIVMMNKIVTDQVRRKLCVPLAPSVQMFLRRLTSVHIQQAKPMGIAEGYPLPPIKGESDGQSPYGPKPDDDQGDFLFNDPNNPMLNKNNKNEIKKKMRLIKKLLQKYEKMAENCQVKVEPVRDYLLEHLSLMHKLCVEKTASGGGGGAGGGESDDSKVGACSIRPELQPVLKAPTKGTATTTSATNRNGSLSNDADGSTKSLTDSAAGMETTMNSICYNVSVSLEPTQKTDVTAMGVTTTDGSSRPDVAASTGMVGRSAVDEGNPYLTNYYSNRQRSFYYPKPDRNMSNKYKKLVEAAATYRRKRQIEERLARLFGKRDVWPEEAQKRQVQDLKEVQDLSRVPYETPVVYSLDG